MVKLSKFYITVLCAVLFFSGCGATGEKVTEEHQTVTETTEKPEKEEAVKPEEEEPTIALHPVTADGINYLDIKGISLEPKTEIAMVAANASNPFYNVVKKGAVQAVADLNQSLGYTGKEKIKLSYAAPEKENVIEQINIIDQFLDKAPDALCIAFTDATACKTQIQMAKNNGIQLVAFDAPDDGRLMKTLVTTDNMTAAREAATKLFEKIEDGGKVAVLVHNSQTQTGLDRYRAITSEYTKNYSHKNLRFVDIIYLAQDNRSEKEILQELLEAYPDLSGIICTDLLTTEMVIDYTKNLEEKSFDIVGFDVSEKIINAVNDGTILGTMAQDPYSMGYATIVAAARSMAGMENAEAVNSCHLWIDASNLDSEEAQSLLIY